ncbi:glycosyltransferase family 39 protein [Robiginitalea sp. M366]|uniref:glycosyltransferase family 39 protein n=1 Tax=Robiginitalea aestuariiviva TaxID=3036903 RepID=UPI00240E35E3|nr:glycosyltransferase family 39 protein [Robiginitalea aestuariiviva]MDG1572381.1 glycosyltransferase family 39 protein [Robiginitalea aestuariiviva]
MISKRFFWVGILGLLGVYIAGLPATLMENDSAQFAVMAMRMVQEHDFWSLWKGPEEYLDKPHLHYWLAAFSYLLFGVQDWAYRLPALLATCLGAWSVFGLGRMLYGTQAGRMAALIFMSAQTIVLAGIDVRTDAVLTGCTAFALWQWMRYLREQRLSGLLWGALGAGLAFSTKGQIALVVIGLPLLCHVVATRGWKAIFHSRFLLALLVFGLVISPVLYAYYLQFDLHPEKVIRGRDHRSGVLFILWEQSFERLSGEGVGKNSSDYFFFFHTFLWVFLPWTLMGLAAYGRRLREAWRYGRGRGAGPAEWLTLGGITLIFLLISFAQFKLPHYLNITIPLFAVLTAGFLWTLQQEGRLRWLRRAARVQAGIFVIFLLAMAGILCWVFPQPAWQAVLWIGLVVGVGAWMFKGVSQPLPRLVGISLWAAVALNALMNAYFYPHLLRYQAGSETARLIRDKQLPVDRIYKLDADHTWALDFYFGQPVEITTAEQLAQKGKAWVYLTADQLDTLKQGEWQVAEEYPVEQFRISRLQARFLNPETRGQVVRYRYLARVIPAAGEAPVSGSDK